MAETVYVFGAGASVSAGVPTMEQFIDRAEELLRKNTAGLSISDFQTFFDLVQTRLPLLHAKSVVDLGNIESVFSLVEMGRLIGRLPGTPDDQIEGVAASVKRVLSETLQQTCTFDYSKQQTWHPGRDYLAIAGVVENNRNSVALITFNYDLALDFALHWSQLPVDYGLGRAAPGVPYLKLHGSLNWTVCSKCQAVDPVPLSRVFDSLAGTISNRTTIRRPLLTTRLFSKLQPHCTDAQTPPDVALVPPTWNKTQYHAAFASVWRRAARELQEATEIIVIGYSLPQSDAFFRDLIALGLVGSTRLRSFKVVNPDKEVGTRFTELLGPDARRRFQLLPMRFNEFVEAHVPRNPRDREDW